jgi:hypothetical protein
MAAHLHAVEREIHIPLILGLGKYGVVNNTGHETEVLLLGEFIAR